LAVEELIGLKVRGEYFELDPVIPKAWKEFSLVYKRAGRNFNIRVDNKAGVERGVKRVLVEGSESGAKIRFDAYGATPNVDIVVELGA
jgi:cellobiose phosphorylase